ncbi:hypothetical protein GCM10022217_24830 [Chryseobacterium ginsenosidimutans]
MKFLHVDEKKDREYNSVSQNISNTIATHVETPLLNYLFNNKIIFLTYFCYLGCKNGNEKNNLTRYFHIKKCKKYTF